MLPSAVLQKFKEGYLDIRIRIHYLSLCITSISQMLYVITVAYPGIFFGGGSTNSFEGRGQNGDLGAVAP
jgi:hypothetical protein